MKKLIITGLALAISTVALSACSSPKSQALAKCETEAGQEEAMCKCFINGIDENVDADTAEAMFKAMIEDDGSMNNPMTGLDISMAEQISLAGTMMQISQTCIAESISGE